MELRKTVLAILIIFNYCYLSSGEYGFFDKIIHWVDSNILGCSVSPCCNEFIFNSAALEDDLRKEVHGQHLVVNHVVNILRGHTYNPNPNKALVLSFHGWTGCGKNFVSKIISKNLFKDGEASRHVKLFIPTHDFPHESRLQEYKDILVWTIRERVRLCSRALLIFDEVDKMPTGLLDVLRPFLDHHPSVGGIDYRKATFIFLSNTGSRAINEITFDHWKSGKVREDLNLTTLEQAISDSAYNEVQGGLWHASLIELNLITAFIPFLPLDRHHVALCIRDELKRHGLMSNSKIVEQISKDILFWPEDYQMFSKSGCKRVSQKVAAYHYSRFSSRVEL